MQIYLRQSVESDAEDIMNVINQAKAFLKSYGSPQWQDGHPNMGMIKADIAAGISYVLIVDGQVAGTAALQNTPDPNYKDIYDGQWVKADTPYATIHRIAVSTKLRGHHLASYLLSNLLSAGLAQGIHNFRYDTHAVNLPMQKLGEAMGFQKRGIVYVQDKIDRRRIGFELNL
ncbi:GNAT family N-acetyltransferase [Limosilactobacillus sp.]|uniref:GNAT family N-acetyltransferase n=1 Tax=Limosilactobacillus sp. TaxID=2773925 RepID=UPI00345E856C